MYHKQFNDLNAVNETSFMITGANTFNKPSGSGERCIVATFIVNNTSSYALQLCGDYSHQSLYFRIGLSRAWVKLSTA